MWVTVALKANHGVTRLKNSSRDFQPNCVISLFFYVHLVFHACVQRFDGMDQKILDGKVNRALVIRAKIVRCLCIFFLFI